MDGAEGRGNQGDPGGIGLAYRLLVTTITMSVTKRTSGLIHCTCSCVLALLLAPIQAARADGLTDGEGRPYELSALRGRVIALTFGSPATKDEVARINLALEARAPSAEVALVSVIDISGIPSMLHGYARRKVAESQHACKMKLLVDDKGSLRQPLRVQPDRRVDILIIDTHGAVRGRFRGEGEVSQALHLLAELNQAAPKQAVALR